jgi:zinc protease
MSTGSSFGRRSRTHQLENGFRLTTLPNPHAPTVTIAGTLSAGPALATDGRYSVPGLTAAMLDRGTVGYDRLGLASELEDYGLQMTVRAASSSPTIISFSCQGLAEQLPRMVRLLGEVLRRPSFPESELDKLREQVLGSLVREREETQARAYAALTRSIFPEGHPLMRRPIEVREREIAALGRDDLAAFHAAVYGPASLVAAVVGSVEHEEVTALFDDEMADWRGGVSEDPQVPEPGPSEPATERIVIADRPNIDIFLGHRGEVLRGADDYAAAVLANACLGQSTLTSRLGVEVRDRAGLTYGIASRFFGTLKVPGPWAVSLGVARENVDRAVEMSREVIARYVEEGPGEKELADEQTALAGSYRVGLATNSGVARELVMAMTSGEGVERLDRFPDQLLSVTPAEVRSALRRHIRPAELSLAAAGDFGE